MRADLAILEVKLGHRFTQSELLRRALTHSSLASETRGGSAPLSDNEQLEFLGDAVLGMVVSDVLFRRFPLFKEGELSTVKARLVSAAHLHGVARRLDLGEYLELGRGEEMSGGRSKKTLLVDALEAIIAAIYLELVFGIRGETCKDDKRLRARRIGGPLGSTFYFQPNESFIS